MFKFGFYSLAIAALLSGGHLRAHQGHDFVKQNHERMKNQSSNDKFQVKQTKRKDLDQESKAALNLAFEANEDLFNSFFNYDGKKVEQAALSLKTALEQVKDPELVKLLSFSKGKLAEIKADKEREDNNQNYHLVSMALIHIKNAYQVGDKYKAYSCPMVMKKWIQNTEKIAEVHNPYDASMPHCGQRDEE